MNQAVQVTEKEIKQYYDLAKKKREIDQELKKLKSHFHHIFDETIGKKQKGKLERGNYKIERQVRMATSYDDALTVEKLTELQLGDLIDIKKQPNKEKLEAAIKVGLLDGEELVDCKKTKVTQALVAKLTI